MDTGREALDGAMRARAAARRRMRPSWPALALLVAGALSFLVLPLAILVAAGMLPTLVAWVTEGPRHRHLARCLASMNFAGVLPVALDLWRGGADVAQLVRLLSDPGCWLVMFAAAAVGWVIYLVVPPLYTGMVALNLSRRREFVAERQRLLEAEWGLGRAGLGDDRPELPFSDPVRQAGAGMRA